LLGVNRRATGGPKGQGVYRDGLSTRAGAFARPHRVFVCCRILLAVEIGAFLFIVAGTHGLIVPLSEPTSTDFVSFYAAGRLAKAGTPELAYDQARHHAEEERATAAGVEYRFFYYPPVFLLLCAALARLPYMAAFLTFEAATLGLYLIVARGVSGERGRAVLVPLLAFPAVFWTVGLGQNAFLTAALFGAGMLCIDRRRILAGLVLGALCYKPHFGLLVPVALVAGHHWRAFGAAFFSAAALCGLSLILLGWETWHDFLAAAAGSPAIYESGRVNFAGFVSPFGAVLLLGGTRAAAYAVQAVAALAAALLVAIVWRRGHSLPIRAAILAAATLVAIPVVLIYDLMLAVIAGAWLIREGALPGWEKVALAGLFVLPLDPRGIAEAWHLPIAPFLALALLALAAMMPAAARHRLHATPRRREGRLSRRFHHRFGQSPFLPLPVQRPSSLPARRGGRRCRRL
jgi:glycosyl transferase family 87